MRRPVARGARRLGLVAAALVAVLGGLAACSPLKTINALVPGSTYRFDGDLAYGPGPREKLDVYRPVGTPPPGGWPVVVFFYGGSWNSGERAEYKFVGEALASRGIVVFVPDYRLYPEVTYPDFLSDCGAALGYALHDAARWSGDPQRVFVAGHSAGAYNAAMLALDPRWLAPSHESPKRLAGWIGLAGPYNFLPIETPEVKPVFHHPNYPPGTQPIDYVRAGEPRAFLGAARDDDYVDPQINTLTLADRLKQAGVPVTLKVYPRANHMTLAGAFARPLRWIAPVLDDTVAFIQDTPPAR